MKTIFCLVMLLIAPLAQAHKPQGIWYSVEDGRVSLEAEGQGTTAQTPFAIASVGKLMTSVAVLKLVEQGRLDLDDTVASQVPAALATQAKQWSGLKVHHLLTMTSGIPDYFDGGYSNASNEGAIGAVAYVDGEPMLFRPGRRFNYSNTNYVLLGLIIEQVTGQSYARAMDQLVLQPAGMRKSFVFGSQRLPSNFATGHQNGSHVRSYYEAPGFGDGGVIASAEDLARFYQALFVSRTLLRNSTLNIMLKDPVGSNYGMGVEVDGSIVGHSGSDQGFVSDIRLDLSNGDLALTLQADADADTSRPAEWIEE